VKQIAGKNSQTNPAMGNAKIKRNIFI